MKRALPSSIALGALLASAVVRAQGPDPAAAQAMFDEAKSLVAQGKYAEACPRFLTSFKLDPKPGAVLNLADCYEKNGQTASAWARYQEAASMAQRAGQVEREKAARDKVAAIEPRLVRLKIAAVSPPPGLEVSRDGAPIDATMLGIALPVDPGRHQIDVRAPGKKPWSKTIDVPAGPGNVAVEIPALEDGPSGPPPPPVGKLPPPLGATQPPPGGPPVAAESPFPRKTVGFAAIGVGGAALVMGAVTGGLAIGKHSSLASACDKQGVCVNQDSAISSYHLLGTLSDVGLIVGGVVAAAGVILVATAPKVDAPRSAWVMPVVGPGFAGAVGRF